LIDVKANRRDAGPWRAFAAGVEPDKGAPHSTAMGILGTVALPEYTAPLAALRARRAIAIWLLICAAMVFIMVIIGGLTRLTHSGLSMVEWKPLTGFLPPMTEAEWERLFAGYRQFPEFIKLNADMTLGGFKAIFWLEFIHRVWGRAIGVVFFVPFLYFLLRGRIDRSMAPGLVVVFILGALQGGLGWYMVKSGLIAEPDVSQYRLAAHLGAAFLIYGYLVWMGLGLLRAGADRGRGRGLGKALWLLLILVSVTVLAGGLVAGLDAGLIHNTFPLMDGEFVPSTLLAIEPAWANFFENASTVQFEHRMLAMATLAVAALIWLTSWRLPLSNRVRRSIHAVALVAGIQFGLGVATLLSVVWLPLAITHQAGALILFTTVVWALRVIYPPRASI